MCGEKADLSGTEIGRQGSPPRVRGKVTDTGGQMIYSRITPACAGKSVTKATCLWLFKDHPRVCGEKTHKALSNRLCGGSPPRVRGKVDRLQGVEYDVRITPACAGKSLL